MPISPYWQTRGSGIRLYLGDVLQVLRRLPTCIVQTVVTSPPYWGLRDYGISGQLGLEQTPEEYVQKMVEVFHEVRRVLRDDGTLWLNLVDTYSGGKLGRDDTSTNDGGLHTIHRHTKGQPFRNREAVEVGSGNLHGIPWRVAFALQADGWVLRQDIIWHKPSPMPESVTNRCTKAHEYLFLLTKKPRYYYDAEAIKVSAASTWNSATSGFAKVRPKSVGLPQHLIEMQRTQFAHNTHHPDIDHTSSNRRSVWTIAASGYDGAHFAVFPEKLVEPCILAGTSAVGCCPKCRAPYRRVKQSEPLKRSRPRDYVKRTGAAGTGNHCANSVAGVHVETTGWEPTCRCPVRETVPCTVLDPFVGSGTTCAVALALGRRCWGIDLSEAYLRDNAIPRIEGAALNRPECRGMLTVENQKMKIGKTLTT